MNSLVGLGATASFAVSAVAALLPRLGERSIPCTRASTVRFCTEQLVQLCVRAACAVGLRLGPARHGVLPD